jgi:hypothetical protein
LHVGHRDVFLVRRDRPHQAERIGQRTAAVAIELVLDRILTLPPAAIACAKLLSTSGT